MTGRQEGPLWALRTTGPPVGLGVVRIEAVPTDGEDDEKEEDGERHPPHHVLPKEHLDVSKDRYAQ